MPLLEYATPKLARFEDARVGVLRAALAAVILAYVAVYQFAFHGSWAQGVPVTGTARVTIQQPTVGACDPALAGCLNAFRNKSSLPYCAEFAPAPADVNRTPGSILPCAFFAAPLPVGAELNGATVAVTRIKSGAQTNVCDPRANNCAQIFVPSEAPDAPGGDEPTYVADMESFTIGMDHTAWAAGDQQGASEPGDVAIASRQKQGKLFVPKNDELCRSMGGQVALERDEPRLSAPCYVKPNTTRSNIDLFRLDVLLLAAARQPTLQSQLDLVNFDGKTFRETGGVLNVAVIYSNMQAWGKPGDYVYEYRAVLVPGSSFKLAESFYMSYRTKRVMVDAHGVLVQATVGGMGQRFSLNYLMVQLTSALVLLGFRV